MGKKQQSNLEYKVSSSPNKRLASFKEIPVNKQGEVLLRLSKKTQLDILRKLKSLEIVRLVNYLDPDDATDLLQNVEIRRRKKLLTDLERGIKKKVEFLLKFDPRTAAGMMSLDYIQVKREISFEKLSKLIRKHEKRTGKFPAVLIVEEGFLVGEIPLHSSVVARKKEKVGKYVKKVPHIQYNKDEKEVISMFEKHSHNKIVVLDEDDSILGVIYSDDILSLIKKQSAKHLSDFAGISEEEDIFDSAFTKVKYRYKWLILNLFTAFLAASVISLFKNTISAFVLLAVYMPIVAGMGGNAGTQTLAVVVRGLALKKIEFSSAKRVIVNEAIAGGINGIINGVLVAMVAVFWNKNPMLGLIIGLAMIVNLVNAGLFGATIPVIMKKLGKDPATSATIFITTATDVFGFFVFLGLATLLL